MYMLNYRLDVAEVELVNQNVYLEKVLKMQYREKEYKI
jgi:hypothetical protein